MNIEDLEEVRCVDVSDYWGATFCTRREYQHRVAHNYAGRVHLSPDEENEIRQAGETWDAMRPILYRLPESKP